MNDFTEKIRSILTDNGADLVGFGDLTELPEDVRSGLPVGISFAMKYPASVIKGIAELPTPEYFEWYTKLNERLDELATLGAEELKRMGYSAIAQTRAYAGSGETQDSTVLPQKTVATRSGLGWIGKCALLVTESYGSMVRFSSILTDAPLDTAQSVNQSKCGNCVSCKIACPGDAVSGKEWKLGLYRDEFFDAVKCRSTAKERARQGLGREDVTICGKCIEICPYTQRYIRSQ